MPKSKKTNHSSKTNGSPLREIAVSAGWGLAVIALLLVLLSLLLCSRDIPAGMTLPLVTVALAAGTLRPQAAPKRNYERGADRRDDVLCSFGSFAAAAAWGGWPAGLV